MSTETLRRAAALMRERAKRAERAVGVKGPWGTSWDHQLVASDGAQMADCFDSGLIAEHLASWHPAVALAVADWLDDEAIDLSDVIDGTWEPGPLAVAVARAYLGSDQ